MLASIAVESFRCIRSATLDLDARVTQISGPNASGKTSLLEAIFFLAHCRSFRTHLRSELITSTAGVSRVVGSLYSNGPSYAVGVEFSSTETTLRLAGHAASAWQVARVLPVQIIDPSVHRILEEGSSRRRRLIDWGVFHVKPHFPDHWRRYQRALLQRNALLKAGTQETEIKTWTDSLVAAAPAIDADRRGYLDLLTPRFEQLGMALIGEPIQLIYRQGWASDLSFSEALERSKTMDRRLRRSNVGPHRADWEILVSGHPAKRRISRGQQKLLAAALILAQIELRATTETTSACLLLDDPAAELDVDNLGKLLQVVATIPAQIVVTSLAPHGFPSLQTGRAFHVEQGNFRPVL